MCKEDNKNKWQLFIFQLASYNIQYKSQMVGVYMRTSQNFVSNHEGYRSTFLFQGHILTVTEMKNRSTCMSISEDRNTEKKKKTL